MHNAICGCKTLSVYAVHLVRNSMVQLSNSLHDDLCVRITLFIGAICFLHILYIWCEKHGAVWPLFSAVCAVLYHVPDSVLVSTLKRSNMQNLGSVFHEAEEDASAASSADAERDRDFFN